MLPTPTPLPPDPQALARAAQIDLGATTDLWDIAPNVLQLWGQFGTATQVLQWVLIAAIVVGIIWAVTLMLKRMGNTDMGEE